MQTFFVLDDLEFYGHHVCYLSPMEIDHQELILNFHNFVAELVDSAKSGLWEMQPVGPIRSRLNLGADIARASAIRQLIILHIFLRT